MRVLIIEDNDVKLNRTIKYLRDTTSVILDIDTANTVNLAKRFLKQNQYDRIIIDMQLPIIAGKGINQEGGISVLLYLPTTINENTKRVINSSSDETRHVLDKHDFKNEILIINNSGRNNTSEFNLFINN
jgi:CheY-like chemotaxis protein